MSANVLTPEHSFVRFDAEPPGNSCGSPDVEFCFPIVHEDDVAFQFIIETDTEQEANELCDIGHTKIQVGITTDGVNFTRNFTGLLGLKPERYRIASNKVLYNWSHGAPDFDESIAMEGCFQFMVRAQLSTGVVTGLSSCFQRIPEDCFTSVIEFASPKNAFGFIYCGYFEDAINDGADDCIDFVQPFVNQSVLSIPYTQAMRDQYGDLPDVEVFIHNPATGLFEKTILSIGMDAVPPTVITVDLGGPSSGYIKIS